MEEHCWAHPDRSIIPTRHGRAKLNKYIDFNITILKSQFHPFRAAAFGVSPSHLHHALGLHRLDKRIHIPDVDDLIPVLLLLLT